MVYPKDNDLHPLDYRHIVDRDTGYLHRNGEPVGAVALCGHVWQPQPLVYAKPLCPWCEQAAYRELERLINNPEARTDLELPEVPC